jgi:hypothetical protein
MMHSARTMVVNMSVNVKKGIQDFFVKRKVFRLCSCLVIISLVLPRVCEKNTYSTKQRRFSERKAVYIN